MDDMVPEYEGLRQHHPNIQVLQAENLQGWVRDEHTPSGVTPLGCLWADECYRGGTGWAARVLGRPQLRVEVGLMGAALYARHVEESSIGAAAIGCKPSTRPYDAWVRAKRFLELDRNHISSLRDLSSQLRAAREHQLRAWKLHFLFMYSLKASLEAAMRLDGIDRVFETSVRRESSALSQALRAKDLMPYLARYGDRFLFDQDISSPTLSDAWNDELRRERLIADFCLDEPLAQLPDFSSDEPPHLGYLWWSEDHYAAIEWRASLPIKHALGVASERLEVPVQELVFLFWDELTTSVRSGWVNASLGEVMAKRRAVHAATGATSAELPPRTIQGKGVVGGRAQGPIRALDVNLERNRDRAGYVLVGEAVTSNAYPILLRAAACVVERGGEFSHAAILCRELGVPLIVGASGASSWARLSNREAVVDADLGVAYLL